MLPGCGFRGVRPPIEPLDPHPPHRGDMLAPDLDALADRQIAQHLAARKRMLHMQLVDPTHDRQVGRRHRPGLVEAAPAQVQDLCLPPQRQVVRTVDHRLALSMPALLSAHSKKSFSSASSSILACSVFTSPAAPLTARTRLPPPPATATQSVIWFGCTSNCCASSPNVLSPQRHHRLERRCVVPSRPSRHRLS